jgi:hypothetical protein
MNETYTYELERWVYETSDANLTFAERLQKRKWEADKVVISRRKDRSLLNAVAFHRESNSTVLSGLVVSNPLP